MAQNVIMLNRGDTFSFDLTIDDENSVDGRYLLKDDDVLYFGIMDPRQMFEDALIRKRYTKDDCDYNGNLTLKIEAADTLDLYPGKYYYSVKLHKKTDNDFEYIDEVVTVIPKTKLIILE